MKSDAVTTGETEKAGPRTRGPSPEKTARTREQILKAALQEFLENGFVQCTMAGVARRAGLAKGTPYRYFQTKEELFLTILKVVVTDPLEEAGAQPILTGESVLDYCHRALVPTIEILEESGRGDLARLVLTEGRVFPPIVEAYRADVYLPFIARLERLCALARERGEVAGNDPKQMAYLLAAPLWIGLLQNGILDPDQPISLGALFEAQLRLVFGEGRSGDGRAGGTR